MKNAKILATVVLALGLLVLGMAGFNGCAVQAPLPSANQIAAQAQKENAMAAVTDTPVPKINYFVERKTVAKWAEYWDKPSVVTYVYCISFGKVIGYYVCNGRPASTRSYLTPETQKVRVALGQFDGETYAEAPDIDGCYGDNNPGIRGFTASGIPFEWSGYGATQFITGAPLSLDVPCLGK